jgi:hypothetical protein
MRATDSFDLGLMEHLKGKRILRILELEEEIIIRHARTRWQW